MKLDVEWTPQAQRDFAAIDDFYAHVAPEYAARVGRDALKAALYLAHYPAIGAPFDVINVRKWRIKNTAFLLFYRVKDARLQILRVRHMAENWQVDRP